MLRKAIVSYCGAARDFFNTYPNVPMLVKARLFWYETILRLHKCRVYFQFQ